MKYGLVFPMQQTLKIFEFGHIADAQRAAGLEPLRIDHGTITRDYDKGGIGITVYEFGLLEPEKPWGYFTINKQLFAGGAVLYSFDAMRETVNFDHSSLPAIAWYTDVAHVELAIAKGEIIRPYTAINGEVLSRWPNMQMLKE